MSTTDDILDFEDFGDIEDFEDMGDMTDMTEDELKAAMAEYGDDLSLLDEDFESGEIIKKDTTVKDKKQIENEPQTEENKTPQPVASTNNQDASANVKTKADEKIITSQDKGQPAAEVKQNITKQLPDRPLKSAPSYNQNNNFAPYNFNPGYNKFYGQQHMGPGMMAMNMFPVPQFGNRIYVNPKFNQVNMNGPKINNVNNEAVHQPFLFQQQQAELDKKRREAFDALRKQKQSMNNPKPPGGHDTTVHNNNGKRMQNSDPENTSYTKRHEPLRPQSLPDNPASSGFSIKGTASGTNHATNSSPLIPRNPLYTPPHQKTPQQQSNENVLHKRPTSAANRLDRPNAHPYARPTNTTTNNIEKTTPKVKSIPATPIVLNGKSSSVIIKDLDPAAKAQLQEIAKDALVDMNSDKGSTATVSFESIDAAVNFRRKYNRTQVGNSHISITFSK